jgi:hypothetical protein
MLPRSLKAHPSAGTKDLDARLRNKPVMTWAAALMGQVLLDLKSGWPFGIDQPTGGRGYQGKDRHPEKASGQ